MSLNDSSMTYPPLSRKDVGVHILATAGGDGGLLPRQASQLLGRHHQIPAR